MSSIAIPVDIFNPCEVLACGALHEIAAMRSPACASRFETDHFILKDSGTSVSELISMLVTSKLYYSEDSDNFNDGHIKPFIVSIESHPLRLDWWIDCWGCSLDKGVLKTWAGHQYHWSPSVDSIFSCLLEKAASTACSRNSYILAHREGSKARFGFDPAAHWDALKIGYSLTGEAQPPVAILSELLCFIGLETFRPHLLRRKDRAFSYVPWRHYYPVMVARQAFAGALGGDPLEFRKIPRTAEGSKVYYWDFSFARSTGAFAQNEQES